MPKFRIYHQVTIDEYIEAQERAEGELFSDDSTSTPAVRRSRGPCVGARGPVFPGAVDGVGAPALPVSTELRPVATRGKRRVH